MLQLNTPHKPRLMILDEDRIMLQSLAQFLSREGYEVKTMDDPAAELATMESHQIELLQRAVDAYTAKTGRTPDWAALARGGYVRGAVVDPNGDPYRLDGSIVTLDPKSKLLPLPWEGQKVQ